MTFTEVVVPYDGSERSLGAAAVGRWLARRLGRGLRLLSVVDGGEAPAPPTWVGTTAGEPAVAETTVVGGSVGSELCAWIDDAPEALVCMASAARRGVAAAVLGSVAEEVVRSSPRPVVLVGPECRPGDLPDRAGELVACVDGSASAEGIAEPAARVAGALGLDVRVVEVVTEVEEEVPQTPDRPLRRASTHVADAQARLAALGVDARVAALAGHDPVGAIVQDAERHGTALLALTTHAPEGWDRVLRGSVAMRVVHEAPCPVLVRHDPRPT